MDDASFDACERLSNKLMAVVRQENPELYELMVATASITAFAADALGMTRDEFTTYAGRAFDVNRDEKMKEMQ